MLNMTASSGTLTSSSVTSAAAAVGSLIQTGSGVPEPGAIIKNLCQALLAKRQLEESSYQLAGSSHGKSSRQTTLGKHQAEPGDNQSEGTNKELFERRRTTPTSMTQLPVQQAKTHSNQSPPPQTVPWALTLWSNKKTRISETSISRSK